MTIVGAVGLFLSFVAVAFAWRRLTFGQLATLVGLLFVHIGLSVYYESWSLSVAADSWGYYYDPANYAIQPWGFGSIFVAKLCKILKTELGATYLDSFLLFQSFGYAGLMLLARMFLEIQDKIQVRQNSYYLLLLFVPSMSFWTSAIGKDAPLFFAISLCLWSMMQLNRRWTYYVVSLGIMMMFRPHIAMLAIISLALSTLFGSSVSLGRKVALLAMAAAGIWFTAGAVESTFGVNAINASSLTDYIDQKTSEFSMDTGTTSIGTAPFYFKVVSLLFRPLFFDANGVMGWIASIENVGILLAFTYTLRNWMNLLHLMRRVAFVRFAIIYAFSILLVLSIMYYNVGLGLRERVMAYPMIFSALVAMLALKRKQRLAAFTPRQAPTPTQGAHSKAVLELWRQHYAE